MRDQLKQNEQPSKNLDHLDIILLWDWDAPRNVYVYVVLRVPPPCAWARGPENEKSLVVLHTNHQVQ